MKNKKTKLLKNLISRSIHVSNQIFGFSYSPKEESDQYIVDGPAFRELLKAYRWKYKTVKKHRDWVLTFPLNGNEVVTNEKEAPKRKCLTEVENADSDDPVSRAIWAGVGVVIILSYILYHVFLKG